MAIAKRPAPNNKPEESGTQGPCASSLDAIGLLDEAKHEGCLSEINETSVRLINARGAQNVSSFEYLNTSARPGICAIRDLLETWFDHLPYGAQADISGRLRSREDVQHKSAFFELFWHELLRSSGYEAEIHPSMDDVVTWQHCTTPWTVWIPPALLPVGSQSSFFPPFR